MLEQVLRPLRYIPRPSEHKNQRANGTRQSVQRDLVAAVAHRVDGHVTVAVVMGQCDVQKWSVVTERQQSKTEAMKDIDESGVAGPLAEHYQSLTVLGRHLLVIDKTNLLKYLKSAKNK